MTTMPKGINWNEQFYKLLRLSLRLTQEFPVEVDADGWRRLYQTAILKGQANARLYPDKHARQPDQTDRRPHPLRRLLHPMKIHIEGNLHHNRYD